MNSLDRNRRGQSQRSPRAQSMARYEEPKRSVRAQSAARFEEPRRSARAQSAARYEEPRRSAREHSVARFEDPNHLHHHQSKAAADLNIKDYTMTLPASRGRHRSRIYGKIFF